MYNMTSDSFLRIAKINPAVATLITTDVGHILGLSSRQLTYSMKISIYL